MILVSPDSPTSMVRWLYNALGHRTTGLLGPAALDFDCLFIRVVEAGPFRVRRLIRLAVPRRNPIPAPRRDSQEGLIPARQERRDAAQRDTARQGSRLRLADVSTNQNFEHLSPRVRDATLFRFCWAAAFAVACLANCLTRFPLPGALFCRDGVPRSPFAVLLLLPPNASKILYRPPHCKKKIALCKDFTFWLWTFVGRVRSDGPFCEWQTLDPHPHPRPARAGNIQTLQNLDICQAILHGRALLGCYRTIFGPPCQWVISPDMSIAKTMP